MNERTAFPTHKRAEVWFQTETDGFKRDTYTRLKRGDAVNEKYPAGVVSMLLARAPEPELQHCIRIFFEYLAARGVPPQLQSSVADLLDYVCDPPVRHAAEAPNTSDFMQRGIRAISEVFSLKRNIDRYVQNCGSEASLREAIRWLYVCMGRMERPGRTHLQVDDAIRAAESTMRISLSDYQHRAIEWSQFNPWTVLLARGNKRPNGLSIILPLSDDAYDSVLNGQRMTYDCGPDDLVIPSRNLLIEAVVERAKDIGAEPTNPTRALYASVLAQISVFTQYLSTDQSGDIRLLSFVGTPTQAKRMKAVGFRPTGKRMSATGIEFYENRVRPSLRSATNMVLIAILNLLREVLDGPPPD
jgi:hypothetical protein